MNTNQNRWNNGQQGNETIIIDSVPVLHGGLIKANDLIGQTIQRYIGSIPVGGIIIVTKENLPTVLATIRNSRLSVQIKTSASCN